MTGAIDQLGHVQAIGGVNEKIEGFFDTCSDRGLSGTQGVIIPASNVGDLMLRADVVDAASAGTFHVYAVSTIGEAMELLMGRSLHGKGPEALLTLARRRSREFWEMASRQVDV
jgi:predicted ATP-dependent protease